MNMNMARIRVDIEITTTDRFAGWSKQSENENFIFFYSLNPRIFHPGFFDFALFDTSLLVDNRKTL